MCTLFISLVCPSIWAYQSFNNENRDCKNPRSRRVYNSVDLLLQEVTDLQLYFFLQFSTFVITVCIKREFKRGAGICVEIKSYRWSSQKGEERVWMCIYLSVYMSPNFSEILHSKLTFSFSFKVISSIWQCFFEILN